MLSYKVQVAVHHVRIFVEVFYLLLIILHMYKIYFNHIHYHYPLSFSSHFPWSPFLLTKFPAYFFIQRIIKLYFKHLYSTKPQNIKNMDAFLDI